MQALRKWLIEEEKVVVKRLGYLDYESSGLTAGPIYINNIRTPIPRVYD